MNEEIKLNDEAVATINDIKSIDRELKDIEDRIESQFAYGLKGGIINVSARQRDESSLDEKKKHLIAHRQELVSQLQTLTGYQPK